MGYNIFRRVIQILSWKKLTDSPLGSQTLGVMCWRIFFDSLESEPPGSQIFLLNPIVPSTDFRKQVVGTY